MAGNASSVQAEIDELKRLIVSKKGKDTSKSDREKYISLWNSITQTMGICDETVGLLFDGFMFADAEPLYKYIAIDKKSSLYTVFFSQRRSVANENGITLKAALNLFALELAVPTSDDALNVLANAIPGLANNREGKPYGLLFQSIGKVLLRPLSKKGISNESKLAQKTAARLQSVLEEPLKRCATRKDAKSHEFKTAPMLLAWLSEQAKPGVTSVLEIQSALVPRRAEQTGGESVELGAASRPVSSDQEPSSTLTMEAVLAFLTEYQISFEKLKKANHDNELRARLLEKTLKDSNSAKAKLQNEVDGLSQRVSKLQDLVNTLKAEKESLEGRLSTSEEMLSLIDKQGSQQMDESSRRMARKLKVEYGDFRDADDLPMTVELGENMRDQLRNVFRIIASNGIEL